MHLPYVTFLMSKQCDLEVKQKQGRGKVEKLVSASITEAHREGTGGTGKVEDGYKFELQLRIVVWTHAMCEAEWQQPFWLNSSSSGLLRESICSNFFHENIF